MDKEHAPMQIATQRVMSEGESPVMPEDIEEELSLNEPYREFMRDLRQERDHITSDELRY